MPGHRIDNRPFPRIAGRPVAGRVAAGLAVCLALAAGPAWPQLTEGFAFRITGPLVPPGIVAGGAPANTPREILQATVLRLNAARPDMVVAVATGNAFEITLRFKAGRQEAAIEQTVRSAAADSAGLSVSRVDADRLPVLSLVLSGAFSLDQVSAYAIANVRPRLLAIAGVDEVTVCSGMHQGLQIRPDSERWQRLTGGADLQAALRPAIDTFNANTAGGTVSSDGDSYTIEALHGRWIEALAELRVALPGGQSIPLGAFATMSWRILDTPEFCFYQSAPAVIVQLQIRRDTDPAATLAHLREALAAIGAEAPAGMNVTVYSDGAPQER